MGFGFWIRVLGVGVNVSGVRSRVSGFGFRVVSTWDPCPYGIITPCELPPWFGFRSLGFEVWCLEYFVWELWGLGSGVRVQRSVLNVQCPVFSVQCLVIEI